MSIVTVCSRILYVRSVDSDTSVTSQEISDALKAQHGIEIEKNKIVQPEPIKTFGSFQVKAKLGYEISGTINVLVIEA